MVAEAEVAQAAAGKGEADIAVAEQGLAVAAALTRTPWSLITLAGNRYNIIRSIIQ